MKSKIISDSSCDMINGELENLSIVPLSISTDTQTWIDNENVDTNSMINTLEKYKGRSYTACPNVDSWIQEFEEGKDIYIVTMTSGLSGTYNSAQTAAKIYKETYPETNIAVFDTLTTSAQQWLIIEYINELIHQNTPFEKICELTNIYIKKTKLIYMLKSLHNFSQNGRISKTIATAIGFFGINIIAAVTEQGTVKLISKCRGDKKTLSELLNQIKSFNYSAGKFYISHVQNMPFAQQLKTAISNLYPTAKIKIRQAKALCSYYAERGGILIGFETN